MLTCQRIGCEKLRVPHRYINRTQKKHPQTRPKKKLETEGNQAGYLKASDPEQGVSLFVCYGQEISSENGHNEVRRTEARHLPATAARIAAEKRPSVYLSRKKQSYSQPELKASLLHATFISCGSPPTNSTVLRCDGGQAQFAARQTQSSLKSAGNETKRAYNKHCRGMKGKKKSATHLKTLIALAFDAHCPVNSMHCCATDLGQSSST